MPRHKDAVTDHVKRGTYRADRHLSAENPLGIALLREAPPVPETLKDCALAVQMWNDVIPRLSESGRLAPEDVTLIEQALLQAKILTKLNSMLEQEQEDPLVLIKIADARSRVIRMLSDILQPFGVTALGRQRLAATLAAMNAKEKRRAIEELIDEGD